MRISTLSELRRALLPRVLGALKATTYLTLLSLILLAVSARAAQGALAEVSLTLARQLNEVPDLIGSTKLVELNGQPFRVSTAVAPLGAQAVLDRFAEACRNHPGELARVAAEHGLGDVAGAPAGSGREPLVRLDADEDGVLGCLLESSSAIKGSLPETIREFVRTRDASVFGDFLVVYAKNQQNGESHIVAVWTRGPLKILDLFPAQGDAPGSDSALAGRPRDARRLLSGSAENEPYGLRIYESQQAPDALLSGFARDMAGRGWSELSAPTGTGSRVLQHSSGVLGLLVAGAHASKSTLVLLEAGNGDPQRKSTRSRENSP